MSRTDRHPAGAPRRLANGRWAVVAGAFILGWALFLLVLTRQSGEPAPGEAAPAVALANVPSDPLPAPMPAGSSAPLPRATEGAAARVVEEPPPPPVPEQVAVPGSLPPAPEAPVGPPAPVPGPAVHAAELLANQPAPRYPPAALRRGESGTVVLRVQVDAEGRAGDVDIIERSGSRALDQAAAEAALQWRFTPALDAQGRPVPGDAVIPVEFQPR